MNQQLKHKNKQIYGKRIDSIRINSFHTDNKIITNIEKDNTSISVTYEGVIITKNTDYVTELEKHIDSVNEHLKNMGANEFIDIKEFMGCIIHQTLTIINKKK